MDLTFWSAIWLGLLVELMTQPLVNSRGGQLGVVLLLIVVLTMIIARRKQVHASQWWWLLLGSVVSWFLLLPFGAMGLTAPLEQFLTLSPGILHYLYVDRRLVVVLLALVYLLVGISWLRWGRPWLLTHLKATASFRPLRAWQFICAALVTAGGWLALTMLEWRLPDIVSGFLWLLLGSLALAYWWAVILTALWQLPAAPQQRHWALSLAVLACLVAVVIVRQQDQISCPNRPLVIAHRGNDGNNGVPNTLQSLRRTARHHPEFVETDIQRTRDKHFITLHDASLRKMTGHSGIAAQMNLAALARQRVTYHGWHSRLTPFSQYAAFARQKKVPLIVEIKPQKLIARSTVHRYLKLYPDKYSPHYLIHTVDPLIAKQVTRQAPNIKVGMITPFIVSKLPEWYQFYSLDYHTINPLIVKELHDHHKKVFAWTVDSPAIAYRLKQMGIDGIITNNYSGIYGIIKNNDYFLFIQVKSLLLGLL